MADVLLIVFVAFASLGVMTAFLAIMSKYEDDKPRPEPVELWTAPIPVDPHKKRLVHWRALAKKTGLELRDLMDRGHRATRLEGTMEGLPITIALAHGVSADHLGACTVIELPVPGMLPPGMQLTPEGMGRYIDRLLDGQDIQLGDKEVDRALTIRGSDPDTIREILTAPTVLEAFRDLRRKGATARLEQGQLHIVHDVCLSDRLEIRTRSALELARELGAVLFRPYDELASAHDLALTVLDAAFHLEGEVDGLSTRIDSEMGNATNHHGTIIRVDVPGLPGDLRVTLRGEGDGDGQRLGDPILDPLVTVTGPSELATRLDDAELRGDLLAVIHGYPRSRVARGSVTLITDHVLVSQLPGAAEAALALARTLRRLFGSHKSGLAAAAGEDSRVPVVAVHTRGRGRVKNTR